MRHHSTLASNLSDGAAVALSFSFVSITSTGFGSERHGQQKVGQVDQVDQVDQMDHTSSTLTSILYCHPLKTGLSQRDSECHTHQ